MRFPTFLIITVFACLHVDSARSSLAAQDPLMTDSEIRLAKLNSDTETQRSGSTFGLPSQDFAPEKPLIAEAGTAAIFGEISNADLNTPSLEDLKANSETAQWEVLSRMLKAIAGVGMITLVSVGVAIYRKRNHRMRRRRGY